MTKLPPPPQRTTNINRKGQPPKETSIKDNLKKHSPNKFKDMSFKVPYEFWKDYKISALEEGITMLEYIQLTHEFYKKNKEKLKS